MERRSVIQFHRWRNRDFRDLPKVARLSHNRRKSLAALLQAAIYLPTAPRIPDDDEQLSFLADYATEDEWVEDRKAIVGAGFIRSQDNDGAWWLTHPILDEDWGFFADSIEQKSAAGKASAAKRAEQSR